MKKILEQLWLAAPRPDLNIQLRSGERTKLFVAEGLNASWNFTDGNELVQWEEGECTQIVNIDAIDTVRADDHSKDLQPAQ